MISIMQSKPAVILRVMTPIGVAAIALAALWFLAIPPSNTRDWSPDQSVLPQASMEGDRVIIHNVRNNRYAADGSYQPRFEDRTYDLSRLNTLDFIVSPFGRLAGHAFLSFGFDDGRYLSISVEIRKEKGEKFSPWLGMLHQYELMYVVADERDTIPLRTTVWDDDVYIYPIKTSPERVRELFVDMLARINQLSDQPEWYHTVWNSCASNVVAHVNRIAPRRIPLSWRLFFPPKADRLIYDLGLIDTDLPFDQIRGRFNVHEKVKRERLDEGFSKRIRE